MTRNDLWRMLFGFAIGAILVTSAGASRAEQAGTPAPLPFAGVTGTVLATMEPSAAPGYELQLFRAEWEPGSYADLHTHPGWNIACTEKGAFSFVTEDGPLTSVVRQNADGSRGKPEALTPGDEIEVPAGDCVLQEEGTIHAAKGIADETTVIWEAHLYKVGAPGTTFATPPAS